MCVGEDGEVSQSHAATVTIVQAPPTNHTHLDGLNNLPEWQLGGQCVAMVDDGLASPYRIESWGRRGEMVYL